MDSTKTALEMIHDEDLGQDLNHQIQEEQQQIHHVHHPHHPHLHHETAVEKENINFHHEKVKDNVVDAILTMKNAIVTTFDEDITSQECLMSNRDHKSKHEKRDWNDLCLACIKTLQNKAKSWKKWKRAF